MNRIYLACLLLLSGSMAFSQQVKAKAKSKNPKSTCGKIDGGCCTQEERMAYLPWPGASSEMMLQQAEMPEFAMMHAAPEAFNLTQPIGSMILFNCPDGLPGRGYYIAPSDLSVNFLIIIQEWWGLNDYVKQEAERYHAALGGNLHILAVDLYDGKIAATADSAQKLIKEALASPRKENILQGALDYAGRGANIMTLGWCFGGMMSLQTAINGADRVRACVIYYGGLEKDENRIARIRADVLGIFGTRDRSIPNEAVDAFALQMQKAGKHFELIRYDAVHAFANPSNPQYHQEYGDDAFAKSVAFLKKRMVHY